MSTERSRESQKNDPRMRDDDDLKLAGGSREELRP
jgi:hypothetical protein